VTALLSSPALDALVRPRAWPKLALPLVAGAAAAQAAGYTTSLVAMLSLGVFLIGDAMLIFAANDLVDEAADRVRRTREQVRTPKALLDGVVSRNAMAVAALVGAALVLGAGQLLADRTATRAPTALTAAAVFCVVLYEFAPFRLNYRGGGELVEAFGVGVVLPLLGASAFGAGCPRALAAVLPALAFASLAGATASTLADADADAAAGKKTLAVRLGAASAGRASALMLNFASLAAALGSLAGKPSAAVVAIAIGVTLGPSIRAAKAWDGVDAAGLAALKGALRKSVQGAWIAAALGFIADRWLS